MTATTTKPVTLVIPPGNGATAPQPAVKTLPAGLLHLDEALGTLHAHKDAWVATAIDERIALLAEIRQRMAAIGERWVAAYDGATSLASFASLLWTTIRC